MKGLKLFYNKTCKICGKQTFEDGCLNCDKGLGNKIK